MLFDFSTWPVWANSLVFVVAGCLVWVGGTSLSRYADAISERTGLTRALAGALLLGGATSLPEIATTVTASLLGNAPLAVNNLFGGVAMQLAVLAVIDICFVRGALTFFSPRPVLLLGGVLLILQIGLALAAIAAGDTLLVAHVGAWPLLLAVVYVLSLYFMNRFADRASWIAAELPDEPDESPSRAADSLVEKTPGEAVGPGVLYLLFAANSLLVLVGGWAVSSTADALSIQTGIGSGFVGATLVALTTSLPEVSTTTGAVRIGAYTMAVSNIFGTNTLELALLLPSDLAFRPGAVVNFVDDPAVLMGSLGIVMTALYLWGLLERRNRTVLRMGVDSAWVLTTYLIGLGVLYIISN